MKSKHATTLQQKLGFMDTDLVKPKHDEIMFQLDSCAEQLLTDLFCKDTSVEDYQRLKEETLARIPQVISDRKKLLEHYSKFREDEREMHYGEYYEKAREGETYKELIEKENKKIKHLEEWKDYDIKTGRPTLTINQKIWELPVTDKSRNSKFTVGFVDMAINYTVKTLANGGYTDTNKTRLGDLHDYVQPPYVGYISQSYWLYIEVKTEIKSLGELIRQIQHYKEYLPGKYCVVSPETQFVQTLSTQGISFISLDALDKYSTTDNQVAI